MPAFSVVCLPPMAVATEVPYFICLEHNFTVPLDVLLFFFRLALGPLLPHSKETDYVHQGGLKFPEILLLLPLKRWD